MGKKLKNFRYVTLKMIYIDISIKINSTKLSPYKTCLHVVYRLLNQNKQRQKYTP